MDAERQRVLMEGLRIGSTKSKAARKRVREKKIKTQPWRALADEWCEEMWRVYGKGVYLVPWTVKEKALARKLLKEADYETAVKMVHQFIRSWNEAGMPAFPFLWVRRESVLAMVKGQAQTRRKLIDVDEYDEKRDGKQPKIGWGKA